MKRDSLAASVRDRFFLFLFLFVFFFAFFGFRLSARSPLTIDIVVHGERLEFDSILFPFGVKLGEG